jgi:type I restriction enzyme S subunit
MQNQIPKNWQATTLGGTATLNYGKGLPEAVRSNGGVPVYGSSGVSGYHNQPLVQEEGYVIGRKGTVGAVYYSPEPFYPIDTVYYSAKSDIKCNFKFFYYLLKTLRLNKLNSDSAVPGLNRDTAYAQLVLLPTLPEQENIAFILSSFDDKIELNNKIAKTLEQMEQAIFKEWFIKSEKLKVKSEKLEKIAKIIKGKKPQKIYNGSRGRDIEYLLIESFTTNKRFFANENEVPQSDDGDIIVVMDGASSGRIFRGRRGVVGSTLAVIKPKPGISHEFLLLVLKKAEPQLMDNLTGSAIPHLDKDFLKSYSVSVPTPEVMEKFTHIVRSMLQKIVKIENENQKLAVLRDLLLPKLMKGEIRVKSE